MFNKCAACGTIIVMNGVDVDGRKVCGEDCLQSYRQNAAVELVPADAIEAAVQEAFLSKCPTCGGDGPIDVYTATKLTGMVLVLQVEKTAKLCCARCARKMRFGAAGYCALAGWWSPRSAVMNIFVIPMNLVRAMFTRPPAQPSAMLREVVRAEMGQALLNARQTEMVGRN